jgi:hypothetical protein
MSHAQPGGQAPDQANSGRQTGAAAHTRTDHSQGTHTAASHLTSHTRHGDNQAGNGPRRPARRVLPSLEEIAENLNHKGIRRPHGSATWSATSVRKAFVS